MDKPLVSFVMPAYNVDKYIAQAIESVIAQTETRWELIVVDDGSTDNTSEIIAQYASADSRIHHITRSVGSGGVYQPRKDAILAANASIVAPIDADDWIDPDYLEKMLKEKNTAGVNSIYPTLLREEPERSYIMVPRDPSLINKIFRGRDCVLLTLDGWKINTGGGLIDKKLYHQAFEQFDADMTYQFADEFLSRQLLLLAPKVICSSVNYHYRANPQSVTRRITSRHFDFLTNNINLIQFVIDNYGTKSPEYMEIQKMNFHGYFQALRLLYNHPFSSQEKKGIREKLRQTRNAIDFSLLRGKVSPRYYYLMKSKILCTPLTLKIIDRIINRRAHPHG